MFNKSFILSCVIVTLALTETVSQVFWDGEAEDNLWSSEKNWSMDKLPAVDETVFIQAEFVVIDLDTQIKQLEIDTGTFVMNESEVSILESAGDGLIIYFDAELVNEGTVNILKPVSNGVSNHGSLIIQSGQLIIKDSGSNGIESTWNSSFSNFGSVLIENSMGNGIFNYGDFTNSDVLNIIQSTGNGIRTSDTLHNDAGGSITISGTSGMGSYGIYVYGNSDVLLNDGQLLIQDIAGNGIDNTGIIVNNESILIKATEGHGIRNINKIENHGYISIENITDPNAYGIFNLSFSGPESVIDNLGQLYIKNILSHALVNQGHILVQTNGEINTEAIGGALYTDESLCAFCNMHRGTVEWNGLVTFDN